MNDDFIQRVMDDYWNSRTPEEIEAEVKKLEIVFWGTPKQQAALPMHGIDFWLTKEPDEPAIMEKKDA